MIKTVKLNLSHALKTTAKPVDYTKIAALPGSRTDGYTLMEKIDDKFVEYSTPI